MTRKWVSRKLVGLLDDDQSSLDLSAELDGEVEIVVNDLLAWQ